jgi:hypothetical protein
MEGAFDSLACRLSLRDDLFDLITASPTIGAAQNLAVRLRD